jgi:hypothetical protein
MSRTTFVAIALLAVLATPALAGPQEGASGKMVLDEVADGLRRYHREKNPLLRADWLRRLAPTRDPRVAIVIAHEAVDPDSPLGERGRQRAAFLLMGYFIPRAQWVYDTKYSFTAQCWWEKNEADLRRRAQELP